MDILGVDIGTVSVKYVRYRKKGRGIVVSRGAYPYKEGWEDLEGILSSIKNREGANVEVAIGISSQEILKKTFTIPLIPKEEVKEVLEWSASKIISIPLDDMRHEYVMLGEIDERGVRKDEVLFVGAHKEYVNRIVALFDEVGFKKIVLLTDMGFVYLPVVEEAIDGSVAIIDIGGRQTGIYIFDGKKLHLVREIMTAAESFTDVLISGFGLTYAEAEDYTRQKGFDESSSDILAAPLERLGGEIQRTFSVYGQKYPSRPVTRVYLAGRGSQIPHLLEKLKTFLVEEIAHLPSVMEVEDEFLPAYVLAVQKEILVNLLPEQVKAREKELVYTKYARIAGVAVISALVVFTLSMVQEFRNLKSSVESEKSLVSQKREQLDRLAPIRSSLVYNELGPIVAEIERRDSSFIILLKYLASRIPKEVYVKEVEFVKEPPPAPAPAKDAKAPPPPQDSGNNVTLRGLIFGEPEAMEATLLRLMIDLEKSGVVNNVTVTAKDLKELRGKPVMEFQIIAKSVPYEV
ncbi:MAG: pilus assembly protein PilM [Deltaproteobacteria bacterium]|nr:pilus assembly protein PilM [Deltaproteobacteria bacterium]